MVSEPFSQRQPLGKARVSVYFDIIMRKKAAGDHCRKAALAKPIMLLATLSLLCACRGISANQGESSSSNRAL